MKIATLGPKGTCSEAAAMSYLKQQHLDDLYQVSLFNSFEEVIQNLIAGKANFAIIPCAYVNYNKLLFSNLGDIMIHDVMREKTPPFVLASRKERTCFNLEEEYTIASHPSPAPLIEKIPYKVNPVSTLSNVISAKMAAEGLSDLAITTTKAIHVLKETSGHAEDLNILEYFGPVDMVWIIFSKLVNDF